MESITTRRVYRFRLEPTSEQEQGFRPFAAARRWLWNWALEQRKQYYQQMGTTISRQEMRRRRSALWAAWMKRERRRTGDARQLETISRRIAHHGLCAGFIPTRLTAPPARGCAQPIQWRGQQRRCGS